MKTKLNFRVGAIVLACTIAPLSALAEDYEDPDLLSGVTRLACEATLCLSSSLQPSQCNPALDHYFDIEVFKKGSLDWSATVAKRLQFLAMCPSASEPGMPARIDAISKGAGKCDANYLNRAYAGTSYKYRYIGFSFLTGNEIYEVHEIPTVTLNKLPSYCVTYNDHEWTYELSVQYVGTPLHGGKWVAAKDFDAEQAKWNAAHGSSWYQGWSFALSDPRFY